MTATTQTHHTRSTAGVVARAVTCEAQAAFSVFSASARGPGVAAGCHAGPSGVSAYATAEICKTEAKVAGVGLSVGLSFNSGVGIGPGCLSVSLLGLGASFGPHPKVATPLGSVQCAIM